MKRLDPPIDEDKYKKLDLTGNVKFAHYFFRFSIRAIIADFSPRCCCANPLPICLKTDFSRFIIFSFQ